MLRRGAAGWLARLQSGRNPETEQKLQRWLEADPRHAAAFESVQRSYDRAALLRHSEAARERTPDTQPEPRENGPRYALAAALALALLVPFGLLALDRSPLEAREAVMLATAVGEIRTVSLEDGSKVTLDTGTRVEVTIGRSRRAAVLKNGRARFEVRATEEPFTIVAGQALITTWQGVVDVETAGELSRVAVLAGSANVRPVGSASARGLALAVGEGLNTDGLANRQKHASAGGSDWTRGMLQFDGTPLDRAVALANRYSSRQILIEPSLARLRVTGAFRAGDAAGLAKAIAEAFKLTLRQDRDGNLLLSSSGSPVEKKKNGG